MSKKNITKKSMAVIFSLLIISMTFSFAFLTSLPYADAQERTGCCLQTINNVYCADNVYESQCKPNEFLGGACTNNGECRLVSCVVENDCMENVPRDKCIYEYEGRVALGDECTKDCCGIAGRSYGIQTRNYCKRLAYEKGFDDTYIEYFNTQNERECSNHFEPTVKGCCITSNECIYTTRQACVSGEFNERTLCSQIPERCEVHEIGLRCGDEELGNANKVVMKDSAGGEAENRTCSTPGFNCVSCLNESCTDAQYSYVVNEFEGYCANTSCNIAGIGQHQVLKIESGKLKIEVKDVLSKTLLNGQSICYNFYSSDDKTKEHSAEINHMAGRSTGLQNHKLVCNYGKIEIIGLGTDRINLCKDDASTLIAKKITNNQDCHNCNNDGGSVGNVIGDFIYPGISAGWIAGLFSESCTPDKCENIKSPEGDVLCYYEKDFFRKDFFRKGLVNRVVGSCVPMYAPGTNEMCGECGEGGDYIWNVCDKEEAYALGDCQFKSSSVASKAGIFLLSWIGLYSANRIGLFYVEAFIRTLIDSAEGKCTWLPPTPTCLRNYVLNAGKSIIKATTGPALFALTWLLKATYGIAAGFINEVLDVLKGLKSLVGLK